MRTIAHRELRNNSSKILDEVSKGAVIQVTNHGEVVAVIVPPKSTRYDLLVAAGKVHEPTNTGEPWSAIPAAELATPSSVAINELRS
jgi:prevent-host-death family protein